MLGPPTEHLDNSWIEGQIKDLQSNNNLFHSLDEVINESEVSKVLNSLKLGKAVGPDNISNEMLKCGKHHLLQPLTKLFNVVLNRGTFPKCWSQGYMTSIYKAGTHSDPNNFRGLTICNSIGKIFTTIMNIRLDKIITENQLRAKEQNGFVKQARTSDHMFILKCLIDSKFSDKKKLYVAFVDFSKAFDTVWHKGLMYKLLSNGITGKFFTIVQDMYKEVKCCVKTCEGLTPTFNVSQGVKQGEVLSPALFNLYINDIPDIFDNACDPVKLSNTTLNCLMYADDLVILSNSKDGLQNSLNNLQNYCNDWRLRINVNKTKVMVFNKLGRKTTESFSLDGNPLEVVTKYKYLGIYFSSNGSFTYAKDNLKSRAMKACYSLKQTLFMGNYKPKIALSLFDKLIKPIYMYGSEVCNGFNIKKEFSKLFKMHTAEKLVLSFSRFVLGVHKKCTNAAVRGELGIYPIFIDSCVSMIKYFNRISLMPNGSLLQEALQSNIAVHAQGYSCWYSSVSYLNDISNANNINFTCLKDILKAIYRRLWSNDLQSSDKLSFYRSFKNQFQFESYLDQLNNYSHRVALTRLRTSSHFLHIESMRYLRPLIPRDKRFCPKCKTCIENESHFLTSCSLYTVNRTCMLSKFNVPNNFGQWSQLQQSVYLMNAEGANVVNLAKFCKSAFETRDLFIK